MALIVLIFFTAQPNSLLHELKTRMVQVVSFGANGSSNSHTLSYNAAKCMKEDQHQKAIRYIKQIPLPSPKLASQAAAVGIL